LSKAHAETGQFVIEFRDVGVFGKFPGGDDLPFVFSGTLVVNGSGLAMVKSTGIKTEMGKIGKSLQEIRPEETHLQRETRGIVKKVAIVALLLCIAVIIN